MAKKRSVVSVSDQLIVVALRQANANGKQGLSKGFSHWDVDALESDSPFLVRFRCTKKLTNSPPPVTTLVEVVEEGVDVGPATLVERQRVILEFVSPKQH